MPPGVRPTIDANGGANQAPADAATPPTPHDGANPEAGANVVSNSGDTQLSPDLHQKALELGRVPPGLGPVPAVARPMGADQEKNGPQTPKTAKDLAFDAMIKAGITEGQATDIIRFLMRNLYNVYLEADKAFENLPGAISAMTNAGWTAERTVETVKSVADNMGGDTFLAYRAIPSLVESGWTSTQIIETVKSIRDRTGARVDLAFETLPPVIFSMKHAHWTNEQMVGIIKLILDKVCSNAGFAFETLPLAISAMKDAQWTNEKMVAVLKLVTGYATVFASVVYKTIPSMIKDGWTSEQMIDTVRSVVESITRKDRSIGQCTFPPIAAMIEAGWTREQIIEAVRTLENDRTYINLDVFKKLPLVLKHANNFAEFMTKLVGPGTLEAILLLNNLQSVFRDKFHQLRWQGAFNEYFVVALADLLGIEGDYSFLRDIVKLPNYRQTARRWFELRDVLTRGGSNKLHAMVLQSLGARFPNEKPGYYEEVIHALAILGPSEVVAFDREYLAEARAPSQQGVATRTAFLDAARALGISDERHPLYGRYKSLLDKLAGADGDVILAVLGKRGFAKTCDKYRAEATDDAGKKAFAKKLLNALERATQDSKLTHIANRLYDIAEEGMLERLQSVADEGQRQSLEQLQAKGPLWKKIKSSELWPLFIKSSHFMTDEGRKSLLKLMLGLELDNQGRLVYPRYGELEGVLGDNFLKQWREEYRKDFKPSDLKALDGAEGEKALKKQVIAQVGEHASSAKVPTEKASDQIQDLPKKVRDWVRRFGESAALNGEYLEEARGLLLVFEQHYFDIRKTYGDEFANIRTDLRNFAGGRERGVVVAKKNESFEVTGDVTKVALSGARPVFTCQNMEFPWVNQEGEPVHRLIHGQFKVANWEVDGEVVARRLVEVTVDESGREHLLVERLYTIGGFARAADFEAQIVEYARGLGIDEARVHFSDESSASSEPKPLGSADKIYRDTFTNEGMTLEEAKTMKAARGGAVERERPKDDREVRRARPRRDSSRTTASHRRSQTGFVVLPESAANVAKSVRKRFPAAAETADAFIARIEKLLEAFRGNPDDAAKKVSRTLAGEALSMSGKDRERAIAASFVLGFGKAGLEFFLADAGRTVFEDGFAGLPNIISKLGTMGETHAWMYLGGASTGGTVDAVMRSMPGLKTLSPAMNMLIKPWLGLVVGSALDEFAKTGRIDLLAQAKTAVQFKVAGLLVMPLRMAAKMVGVSSGLVGILANAAFLAIELVMVKFYNETMGKRGPALDVIQSANSFAELIGKDANILEAAETLGGSLCAYAQTEGLFGEIAGLDAATTEGGKVTIPYAGKRRDESVLDSAFRLIGYRPDEYASETVTFASGEKARTEAANAIVEGLAIYTGSDGGRIDTSDLFVKGQTAELGHIVTRERMQLIEQRIGALQMMETALIRQRDAGIISGLRYEIDSFAVAREVSIAKAERDFLEELTQSEATAEAAIAAVEAFGIVLQTLRADWIQREDELVERLIPENSQWLSVFFTKVETKRKVINWDGTSNGWGLSYKNITAVSQSFPAEPEKLYLLGKAFGRRYTREKENDEKITPAAFIAAAG